MEASGWEAAQSAHSLNPALRRTVHVALAMNGCTKWFSVFYEISMQKQFRLKSDILTRLLYLSV